VVANREGCAGIAAAVTGTTGGENGPGGTVVVKALMLGASGDALLTDDPIAIPAKRSPVESATRATGATLAVSTGTGTGGEGLAGAYVKSSVSRRFRLGLGTSAWVAMGADGDGAAPKYS